MTAVNFGAKTAALEVVKGLNAKLDCKVVIVTGATSGRNYSVIMIKFKCLIISRYWH